MSIQEELYIKAKEKLIAKGYPVEYFPDFKQLRDSYEITEAWDRIMAVSKNNLIDNYLRIHPEHDPLKRKKQ